MSEVLAPGAQARTVARRAVTTSAWAAVAFIGFAEFSTQDPMLRARSPWQNDPYDVVVSVTVFTVLLVGVLTWARLRLCRRPFPLAAYRLRDVLSGCLVVLAAIGVTAAVDWVAVALRAERGDWNGTTAFLVAALAGVSLAAGAAFRRARAARRCLTDVSAGGVHARDFLGDMRVVRDRGTGVRRVGWTAAVSVAAWIDRRWLSRRWGPRRHPLPNVLAVAVALGTVVAAGGVAREGFTPTTVVLGCIESCALFVFLSVTGQYLHLFLLDRTPNAGVREWWVAFTAGCAAVPVTIAFRTHMWWLISTSDARAGTGQLGELLGMAFLAAAIACVLARRVQRRRHLSSK